MNRQLPADQSFVRKVNTQTVIDALRLYAPVSRAELSVRTGLNRSTISSIIGDLIDSGYVQETTLQDPKIGRPGMLLTLNPEGGSAIGIEVGVDFCKVILTNFIAEVIWREYASHPINAPQVEILQQAERLIGQAIELSGQQGLRPLGIGVALPGLVDTHEGRLIYAPNLHWTDIPLRLMWASRFNLPVMIENEANCAALGEHFYGVAHDVADFIFLNTGIGLGGGIMIGGQLFKGANGFAGEVGHITLYDDGAPCACGRKGCWETYVGPRAIVKRAVERIQSGEPSCLPGLAGGSLEAISIEMIAQAAEQNDPVALDTLAEAGTHLALGITNLVNIFNPELVVLGGVISLCSRWLIPVIQEILHKNLLPPLREKIRVEASRHGWDTTVLGAVAFVLDEVLRESSYNR